MRLLQLGIVCILLSPFSCGSGDSAYENRESTIAINQDYWDQGLAEISTYNLTQARYGELREGTATLIFVKEPFSKYKHVKLDIPNAEAGIDVLKLNKVLKFNTGIYPYSVMTSVFSPLKGDSAGRALKITTSCQEWCGHTFTQCNLKDEGWNFRQFSYFESEGDTLFSLGKTYFEDELWNQIRIDPSKLPLNIKSMVPSTMYLRFSHLEPKAYPVEIMVEDLGEVQLCKITYKDLKRELLIRFSTEFPYAIESWEESYPSGWGDSAKVLVTKAKLNKRRMLAYWQLNKNKDAHWRKELGLD